MELIELYEYKVADLAAGRPLRGGRKSVGRLREELFNADLEPRLRKRLNIVEKEYRTLVRDQQLRGDDEQVRREEAPAGPAWDATVVGDTPEVQAWNDLRSMEWYTLLRDYMLRLGEQLGQQPGRVALRVLYAVSENAQRLARGESQLISVPTATDSLVSLHDPEVARRIILELTEQLFDTRGARHVKAALSFLQERPFARHADADVLASQLAAIDREPLAPQAKEELKKALRARYPGLPEPRERQAIREAIEVFKGQLTELMARAPIHERSMMPKNSVLYAAHTPSRQVAPDDGREEMVIHLAGGESATWRGLKLSWKQIGHNWQFQVDEKVYLLRQGLPLAERTLVLQTARAKLWAVLSGNYLMLHIKQHSAEQLGLLATRARAISMLLDPTDYFLNLRLARAASLYMRGQPIELQKVGPGSAERYARAAPDALFSFALNGSDALIASLKELSPKQAAVAFAQASRELGVGKEKGEELHTALHNAIHHPEPLPHPQPATRVPLSEDGTFASFLMGKEPVLLPIGSRTLTLRPDYKGEILAAFPGHPSVNLAELLVMPIPGADIMLVRQDSWVAAAMYPRALTRTLGQVEKAGTDDLD